MTMTLDFPRCAMMNHRILHKNEAVPARTESAIVTVLPPHMMPPRPSATQASPDDTKKKEKEKEREKEEKEKKKEVEEKKVEEEKKPVEENKPTEENDEDKEGKVWLFLDTRHIR